MWRTDDRRQGLMPHPEQTEPMADPSRLSASHSVAFFDTQFRRQLDVGERVLNPFEQRALPHLQGRVLDWGCGLGNLALAAADRGCDVLALDASEAAIDALRSEARARRLPLHAQQADLRAHQPPADAFDAAVSIGLLMFFDCTTARRQLARLQAAVHPGGVVVLNLLVQGTTYLDMFDPDAHCLLAPDEPLQAFAGWTVIEHAVEDFAAPEGRRKRFVTLIARRPPSCPGAAR
jgi:tellurite methyltransferase